MSLQHDNTASTGGDEYSHSPTPRSRSNMMLTLTRSSTAENNVIDKPTVESLILDQVAIIFGFLKHNEIMHARVCTTWRDAAKKTLVSSYFDVTDLRSYNALRVASYALPDIQILSICDLGDVFKFAEGENPDERLASDTTNYATYDLNIISNFRNLHILSLDQPSLNGRYSALFNFPLLQSLTLSYCPYLKWDLEMLSGCPLLRELELIYLQQNPTGNLKSLRLLKNTLEDVHIDSCHNIHGNFMELADCHLLKKIEIFETPITGDIIFGFLKHNEIMHARVCTTWRDAAKKTLVPPSAFEVKNVSSYNAVRAMSTEYRISATRDLQSRYWSQVLRWRVSR